MITPAHSDLAFSLCKFYFGEVAAQVISKLFSFDQLSLRGIRSELRHIILNDLKCALLALVKYQLVDYVKTVKNHRQQYEYSVVPARVFSFFRIPRFIMLICERDGSIASVILKSVAETALVESEEIIRLTTASIKSDTTKDESLRVDIVNNLESLILSRHVVKTGNLHCLNIERLVRDYRDALIINTISTYYQNEAKIKFLCISILKISLTNTDDDSLITAPVPFGDLVADLVPEKFADANQLEKYLVKLTTDSNNRFFHFSGINPGKGPMYALDVGLVIDYLVKEYLSSMITSRFGPKCCRVFRVLLHRGPLMLKQIEEFIMLPARDVREYSYMLIKEGLIKNQQVPKTPDNAPSKSIFIMSVEVDQLVHQTADLCCRTINNLILRHEHELARNKLLLDRSKAAQNLMKSDVIVEGVEQNSQGMWTDYFNSHELSQLDLINRNLNKIFLSKFQVDEMLFLLHSWISLRPDLREEIA